MYVYVYTHTYTISTLIYKKKWWKNGLKIIASKNVTLDVIIDSREMRMCCQEKLGNCLSDGFEETLVAWESVSLF